MFRLGGPIQGGILDLAVVALLGFAAAFLMSWLVQPHFRNLGFLTEIGFESANHGLQVFGGHGYIKETGKKGVDFEMGISDGEIT